MCLALEELARVIVGLNCLAMALDPSDFDFDDSPDSQELPFTQSRVDAGDLEDSQQSSQDSNNPSWYYTEGLATKRPSRALSTQKSKRSCLITSDSESEASNEPTNANVASGIGEMKDLLMKLYTKVEENEKILKDLQNKG